MRTVSAALSVSLIAAIALCMSAPSVAVEVTYRATAISVISSDNGQSRILVGFPALGELREEWVSTADLVIRLSGQVPMADIEIEADALETRWSCGATWTSPWLRPGGDLDGSQPVGATVPAGRAARALTLDMTNMVRAMLAGDMAENGVILYPANPGKVGFSIHDMGILGSMTSAALVIHYRKLTAHGLRGGPEELLKRREQRTFDEGQPRPARDTRAEP